LLPPVALYTAANMAVSLNWSMTAIGYAKHRRGLAAVAGISHMSTHDVLRFAEELHFYTGWLFAQGAQPQLERVKEGQPIWVALAEMFADQRIAQTEGVASGSLIFVAAVRANGTPPSDRSLTAWADENRLPWIEVINNEVAYWGGLSEEHLEALLRWFCCQRPTEQDWKTTSFDKQLWARVRGGLFDHGWTRNLELSKGAPKPRVDLWGGVHRSSILDHQQLHPPGRVNVGLRMTLSGTVWSGKELSERCVLDDDTGKLPLRR
jgi:hypothetical protein